MKVSSSSSSSIEYLYSASGALKPQKRYLLPLHPGDCEYNDLYVIVAILKFILEWTGSQCRLLRSGPAEVAEFFYSTTRVKTFYLDSLEFGNRKLGSAVEDRVTAIVKPGADQGRQHPNQG